MGGAIFVEMKNETDCMSFGCTVNDANAGSCLVEQ